jgi:hypothetical protein
VELTRRDRRALFVLLLVVVALGCLWIASVRDNPRTEGRLAPSAREQLLTTLANRRNAAKTVPQKEEVLGQLVKELALREARFLQADTAAQAQAQLLQILKNLASQQRPPLEISKIELHSPQLVSQAYGEVSVSITIECTIDELLNLIADLSGSLEIVATDEIALDAANKNLKTIQVRLTTTGLVHLTLIKKSPVS